MIKIEIDSSNEGVQLLLDNEGVDEMINYLHFIKNNHESIHLVGGNELDEETSQNGNKIIKHVKIVHVS